MDGSNDDFAELNKGFNELLIEVMKKDLSLMMRRCSKLDCAYRIGLI